MPRRRRTMHCASTSRGERLNQSSACWHPGLRRTSRYAVIAFHTCPHIFVSSQLNESRADFLLVISACFRHQRVSNTTVYAPSPNTGLSYPSTNNTTFPHCPCE